MRTGDEIVAAARTCLGARFRVHGRDPRFGLDCVGVAAVALGLDVPGDYALRGGNVRDVVRRLSAAGLRQVQTGACAGDLLLLRAGPGQLHLAVLVSGGFIHADAGLRRVVEVPGPPAGAWLGAWRGEE